MHKWRRYLEILRPWMFNTNQRNDPALCPRTPRAERGKYQLKHRISKPRLYYYLPTATRRIPTKRRAGAHPDFRAGQSHRPIGHLRWRRESPQWMFRSVSSSRIFARPYFEECSPSSQVPLMQPSVGITSTVLIALIGLEKTLQPLYPNGGAPSSDLHSPQQQSPPLNAAFPGVIPPSQKLASPTLGPHAVPPHSWAKVVARSTLTAGSSLLTLDRLQADSTNAWSPIGPRNRRERKQRIGTGPMVTPSPLSANRGPTPPAGPRWNNGLSSPPERKSGAVAGVTSFAQDLRAVRLTPLSQEEQARTLQQLLFAPPPSDAAMDMEGPSGSRRSRDEPVAFLHVECPNFSAAARKEPKAAWRHLLLSLSKERSPPLRPLDILPMSATKAEIFIPEAQLPTYRAALQTYVLTDPPPLTERDFRRRAAAYRNSYYRAYRQATLRGFPAKHLQFNLLVHIQTDAYTPSPPPTKYKDILRMVEMDLKALQDPLPAAPREA